MISWHWECYNLVQVSMTSLSGQQTKEFLNCVALHQGLQWSLNDCLQSWMEKDTKENDTVLFEE